MTQVLGRSDLGQKSLTDYKLIRFADQYLEVTPEGKAQIFASVQSLPLTNRLEIKIFLQKFDGDWTTVKAWEEKRWSSFCSFSAISDVNVLDEYRIEVYYRAYQGSYVEELFSLGN